MLECTSRPVSWLTLERYALGELDGPSRVDVRAHLDECEACRSCAATIETSDVSLPALELPATPSRPWWRQPFAVGGMATLVVATAVLLMVVMTKDKAPTGQPVAAQFPAKRLTVKGGELALGLVSKRGRATLADPRTYRDHDRFKVLVTCPPAIARTRVDVVVVQAGQLFFPLAAQDISCANQVVIDGAFAVTGTTPITICAVVGPPPGIDRRAFTLARLRRSTSAVCQTLSPAKR